MDTAALDSRLSRGVRLVALRAGVSKCGTKFETLLPSPTQWCVEIFEGCMA